MVWSQQLRWNSSGAAQKGRGSVPALDRGKRWLLVLGLLQEPRLVIGRIGCGGGGRDLGFTPLHPLFGEVALSVRRLALQCQLVVDQRLLRLIQPMKVNVAEEQSDKGPLCQPGLLLCLCAARRFELGQQGVGNRLGLGEIPIAVGCSAAR